MLSAKRTAETMPLAPAMRTSILVVVAPLLRPGKWARFLALGLAPEFADQGREPVAGIIVEDLLLMRGRRPALARQGHTSERRPGHTASGPDWPSWSEALAAAFGGL